MRGAPPASAAREAAIRALLVHVPFEGWTKRALRRGLADIGVAPEIGKDLFPGGTLDLIGAWSALVDRDVAARAEMDPGMGTTARVRALIALRLRLLQPDREAVRRALAALARLRAGGAGARIIGRTADSIWRAAGDRATDFSWYTKRATLAAVYGATLLYWLHDESEDGEASLTFLDRRLQTIGAIARLRGRARAGGARARRASG